MVATRVCVEFWGVAAVTSFVEALAPASFLDRAARAHGDRIAVIDGEKQWTYTEFRKRCLQLAGMIAPLAYGRPAAVLAPNTHVLLEAHFAVPWAGVPLVALNTRLAASETAYILEHSKAGVVLVDPACEADISAALSQMADPPQLIVAGGARYEAELSATDISHIVPSDEMSLLSINYTSGTTGRPKGVMYHHRGAYLQALAMAAHTGLSTSSVFLWTLPMFHCNGWCFPWAVTAVGGTHVCLPKVDPTVVWQLLRSHGITHLNGAPTVLSMLAQAPEASPLEKRVSVATGGAPPTPAILRRMNDLGFDVTHLYGMTETFGPAMICDWRPEWEALDSDSRARVVARQGVPNLISGGFRVIGPDGVDVEWNGTNIGEVALRGNNIMLGYLYDEDATRAAAPDGWFLTGDLGVIHPDGYLELRDRRKDVIISGGENISSVEVECAIAEHPAVLEVAVVAAPDERWGEVPVAFVALREGCAAAADELSQLVGQRLSRFKVPKRIIFGPLPKTSTGKVKKTVLREAARGEATEVSTQAAPSGPSTMRDNGVGR